jgi:1,2-diacylglycerol 3-beta-glucosyltransferase
MWRELGEGGVTALGATTLFGTGYLARLALAARPQSRSIPPVVLRLDVIIPAHNEAAGIGATLESLSAAAYPVESRRLIVIADNCDDATAERAREGGALVLERHDLTRRGKGHALAHGFAWSARDGWAEGVVVVDADSDVNPAFFSALAGRLAAGAQAVQADYRIRNVGDGWRTRLMEVAFALQHTTRSLGRERLGWSCGLRGNGMAFRPSVLAAVPYAAFSMVEDIEYGIQLGLSGVRVEYAHDAVVRGDMPSAAGAARTQRERWERGRTALRAQWTGPLARATVRGAPLAGDLLCDLVVPPLATVGVLTAGGLVAALLLWSSGSSPWVVLPHLVAMGALLAYLARGLQRTGRPWAAFVALCCAPWYIVWKFLGVRPTSAARDGEWVRTPRPADS